MRAVALCVSLGLWAPGGCERSKGPAPKPPEATGPSDAAPDGEDGSGGVGSIRVGIAGSMVAPDPATPPRVRTIAAKASTREKAIEAVRTGSPEAGIEELQKLLAKAPRDLELRLELARALAATGELSQADSVLSDSKAGSVAELSRQRARLMMRQGRLSEAQSHLEDALKRFPDSLELRGQLVELATLRGTLTDSATKRYIDELYDAYDAGKAKTAGELLAVARATLGTQTGGGFKDANQVLSDAERLATVENGTWLSDEIHLLHAEVFREKYAHDEATQTYGMILARDPWHAEALAGLAWVALDQLQLANAVRFSKEALAVDPGHELAHTALAWVATVEGRHAEAREALDKYALKRNPTHSLSLAVAAALEIWKGDVRSADGVTKLATAAHPGAPRYFVSLAELLGTMHLYPETAVITAQGMSLNPKDPYIQSAHGLNLLRLAQAASQESDALAAIEGAWKRDRFNERTFNTRALYREQIEPNHQLFDSGMVSMRLPKEQAALVKPELLAAANKSIETLDQAYGIKIGRLRLEVFAEVDAFSIRTIGTPSLGALGVCFGPVITLLGPYSGNFNFHQVMHHEIAHSYAIGLSKGRVARWLTEGLSEWESELVDPAYARESAELLSAARDAGRLRKLSELDLAFLRAENALMMEVAYATATWAVRYIGQTYGHDKIVAILRDSATGAPTVDLLVRHLGLPIEQLEKNFETWMDAELRKRISGWRPQVDDGKPKDERTERFAKAADLAQSRKTAEAIRELEALIGDDADGFAPRIILARLAVDAKDYPKALKHLEKARSFHRESLEPLAMLAEVARAQSDVDAEIRALVDAIDIDAMSFDPAARLVGLAWATDNKAVFQKALQRCVAIAPTHPVSLAALAHELRKQKNVDKGRLSELLTAAQKFGPGGPPETMAIVALALREHGDAAGAKLHGDGALSNPRLHPALRKALEGK